MIELMPSLLALAIAAILQGTPPATVERGGDFIITTIATRPETCNLRLATKVPLLSLDSEPQKWTGKCGAVDGYCQYRALFVDRRDTRTRYAQSSKALN